MSDNGYTPHTRFRRTPPPDIGHGEAQRTEANRLLADGEVPSGSERFRNRFPGTLKLFSAR